MAASSAWMRASNSSSDRCARASRTAGCGLRAGCGVLRQQCGDEFDVLQRIVGPASGDHIGPVNREIGAQGFEKCGFEDFAGTAIVSLPAFTVARHEWPRARKGE
jgi:hypothetical protein